MSDGLSVIALAGDESLCRFYECAAELAGISCRAFQREEDALPYFKDARLLIVSSGHLPVAGDFSGRKILVTGGDFYMGDYLHLGVDEVWQNPVSVSVLQGLMKKYASDKPRVLLLEDDFSVSKYLRMVFEGMGHDVEHFSNADEAVSSIPSVNYVLSDICQPEGMGGYGLLREVRRIYDRHQLPFILMSGSYVDPELLPSTVHAFLKKPFLPSALEAVVRDVLSERIPKV